jgi:hypothetical protein
MGRKGVTDGGKKGRSGAGLHCALMMGIEGGRARKAPKWPPAGSLCEAEEETG